MVAPMMIKEKMEVLGKDGVRVVGEIDRVKRPPRDVGHAATGRVGSGIEGSRGAHEGSRLAGLEERDEDAASDHQ